MKCDIDNCNEEATIELTDQYATGERTIRNYCNKHGIPIFQKLFREMYGLPPKEISEEK